MHTSNCAADDTKLSKPNRFYSVCAAFLLIVWPLVAVLGLYALGQPLPSLSLLTSPRFLTMQIIVDYSMALAFVACALLFNKRTAKHANVINELRRELAVFKDENGELQDELASVRAELEETRGRLYETENKLAQTQDWLDEADRQLYKSWDDLDSAKSELREAKLELRRAGEYAEFNERCYESLRKEYSETTLDLLKTRRERDDIRSKLVLARKVIRRLLAERNRLQRKLAKARIGFGFYRREYVNAEARVADALRQIKGLESDIEMRDKVISSLLDDVVIRTKG